MNSIIHSIIPSEYKDVVAVWETSVRATHHFLTEEDIAYFKPLILHTYLDAIELRGIKNNNQNIIGFMGVAAQNLEMLFIHPDYIGKGLGNILLGFAIENLNVIKVDVNEQNQQALGFYKHYGFEIVNRSERDATGKPYPILHLELKANKSTEAKKQ